MEWGFMTLAVVIIASEKRRETTFPRVLESVLREQPNEIVVVADFPVTATGVRSFVVPPMTRTTVDALVKRDVGALATSSEHVCYLCDDHALGEGFIEAYQAWSTVPDILVPQRFCRTQDDQDRRFVGENVVRGQRYLEVGQREGYAGGHCAIYKRWTVQALPWAASYHHPNWDVLQTRHLIKLGARISYGGQDLLVEDLEPDAKPWEMTADQRERHEAFHQSIGRAS